MISSSFSFVKACWTYVRIVRPVNAGLKLEQKKTTVGRIVEGSSEFHNVSTGNILEKLFLSAILQKQMNLNQANRGLNCDIFQLLR